MLEKNIHLVARSDLSRWEQEVLAIQPRGELAEEIEVRWMVWSAVGEIEHSPLLTVTQSLCCPYQMLEV